jgi:hypothetical protein
VVRSWTFAQEWTGHIQGSVLHGSGGHVFGRGIKGMPFQGQLRHCRASLANFKTTKGVAGADQLLIGYITEAPKEHPGNKTRPHQLTGI